MIKPLLRVLPSLSGNVKLACQLSDIHQSSTNVWEATVRGATMLPLSSKTWESGLNAGLLSSSWEYDLQKYYAVYSDVFFKSCFSFDKSLMLKLDTSVTQDVRCTDTEFGVSRVSYKSHGKQFAFFAPIYIDSYKDIPDYFDIYADVYQTNKDGKIAYAVRKTIRVRIGADMDNNRAYLGRYLDRYLRKIDSNVAFCLPQTNQATYYGIDLVRGGFVTAVDNMMDRIYHYQNTIHNFDATIAGAFERNRIAMKQVMPLCFYFNPSDFLTEPEQIRYQNSIIEFSGAYYKDNEKLLTYDFETDYMEYSEKILRMNQMTGVMQWTAGDEPNIMDVNFPSLNECRYINYEFANKLAPWFCRWKLKFTDDSHPYVMNNSWAFSKNQSSNYKYGLFPSTFNQQQSLARYTIDPYTLTYNYNMQLPLGDITQKSSGRWLYTYALANEGEEHGPFYSVISQYEQIMNAYCTWWFSTISEYGDSIYDNSLLWRKTDDGCVYYNGILYDLCVLYSIFNPKKEIDWFAVLLKPDIHMLTPDEMNGLHFSEMTLYRQGVSQFSEANVVANDSILSFAYIPKVPNYAFDDVRFDITERVDQDEIRYDEIFKKNESGDGDYIDVQHASYWYERPDGSTAYGVYPLDYYELNKYYLIQDIPTINELVDGEIEKLLFYEDKEFKDILSSYVFPHYGMPGYLSAYSYASVYSYSSLPVAKANRIAYDIVPGWMFNDPSYTWTDEVYKWALTHNNSILNIPPEYADKEYYKNPMISYFLSSDIVLDPNDIDSDEKSTLVITENDKSYIVRMLVDDVVNNDDMDPSYIAYNLAIDAKAITDIQNNLTFIVDNEFPLSKIGIDGYDYRSGDPAEADVKVKNEEFLQSLSYVRHSSDPVEYLANAYTSFIYNDEKLSYIALGDTTLAHLDYGAQYYWRTWMLHASYFPYTSGAFDAYSYLHEMVDDIRASYAPDDPALAYWEYSDLTTPSYILDWKSVKDTHPLSYLAGRILDWKGRLANDISYMLKYEPITEWEYEPMVRFSSNTMAVNVFNERTKWTGNFYGSMIPQSKVDLDNDVLWADPYNLDAVFKKEGYPYDPEYSTYVPDSIIYKDMFVKFLNKQHLFYWYVELYKDAWKKYKGTDDFEKFMTYGWYKDLYVVEDVWIYEYENDDRLMGAPLRRRIYTPLERFINFPEFYAVGGGANDRYRSFNEFYNKIVYNEKENIYTLPSFYASQWGDLYCRRFVEEKEFLDVNSNREIIVRREEQPVKFELCFRKKMARVNEDIWNISHMSSDRIDEYRDMYFYRIQPIIEHDDFYDGIKNIPMHGDISYYTSYIGLAETYTYLIAEPHTYIYEGDEVTYYTYSESEARFSKPHVTTDCGGDCISSSDSMLIPLFDDIFTQPASEAIIYTHYSLHDITKANVVSDLPDEDTGEWKVIQDNYRYNRPDKKLMVEITDQERGTFCFSETYDIYNESYCNIEVVSDDLGMSYLGLSTKVMPDGTSYGFYYIHSHIDNTANSFDVTGVTEENTRTDLRFINYINGRSLVKDPEYIVNIYKELAPFIKQQPLSAMADISTIVYPKTYPYNMIYSQVPATTVKGATETEIIRNDKTVRTMSLLRYFHAMTPLITQRSQIKNEWRLKLKNIDADLLDTGTLLSIGDAPIYNESIHIDKFTPYGVWSSWPNEDNVPKYNNRVSEYTPLEYKFYNNSRAVMLDDEFKVNVSKRLTYKEVLDNETPQAVMMHFANYIKKTKKRFTDDELVFLLNKYDVSFDSMPSGLDISRKEKLYALSLVFKLK